MERTVAGIDRVVREAFRALIAGQTPWPLFMHGPAGTGKTCALLCLLDYAGGEYLTGSGLADLVVQSQQGRLDWYETGRGGTLWPEKLWAKLGREPLVVVDELGARDRVSDHAYECVKRIIDERQGLPLALTSNHDLQQLAVLYDDRIASRIAGGTVLNLGGKDRRLSEGGGE